MAYINEKEIDNLLEELEEQGYEDDDIIKGWVECILWVKSIIEKR